MFADKKKSEKLPFMKKKECMEERAKNKAKAIVIRSHPNKEIDITDFEGKTLVEEFRIDKVFKARIYKNITKNLKSGFYFLLTIVADSGDAFDDWLWYRRLHVASFINEDPKQSGSHTLQIFLFENNKSLETSDNHGDYNKFKKTALDIALNLIKDKKLDV